MAIFHRRVRIFCAFASLTFSFVVAAVEAAGGVALDPASAADIFLAFLALAFLRRPIVWTLEHLSLKFKGRITCKDERGRFRCRSPNSGCRVTLMQRPCSNQKKRIFTIKFCTFNWIYNFVTLLLMNRKWTS